MTKKKFCLILILSLVSVSCFSQEYKSICIPVWKKKINTFTFASNEFKVSLNFDDWRLNPVILNNKIELNFKLDNNIEILEISELNKNTYIFRFSALGFEQIFIYYVDSNKITEPFFDLKNEVSIRAADYNNLVLFGDTWNSDKGITSNQIISLYLFSSARKQHLKIAEKTGAGFNVKIIDDCKIEYEDQNGKYIKFDYSDWIIRTVTYEVSSFLSERQAVYGSENLSTIEGLPWASGNGYGINDVITISISRNNFEQLAFYNGFQSVTRSDLYTANSRVRKIRIKNIQTGDSKEVILRDTPEAQNITFNDLNISKSKNITLEITILEVYPGDRFKDLCIQAIIPYENSIVD